MTYDGADITGPTRPGVGVELHPGSLSSQPHCAGGSLGAGTQFGGNMYAFIRLSGGFSLSRTNSVTIKTIF